MHISNIRVQRADNSCELHADVQCETHWVWGDDPFHLWYRYPADCEPYLRDDNGDPFLAACLLPAMALGESLQIDVPVSQRLQEAVPQIQAIYRRFDQSLPQVDIAAPVRRSPISAADAVPARGLFYSLGVDSAYTLWKNLQHAPADGHSLTHLIVVEGFDVYLWQSERFQPMLKNARAVATELGKDILPVTTNLRDFSDRMANWLRLYHGPALASTVLALGGMFDEVQIAAAQTYELLIPRGAHPLLDPLWSTEHLAFFHDGLEADRLQKIRQIARCETLVSRLRVCTTGELTDEYNCGRCEKCLRTMIGLHIAGVLSQCQTLPHQIDIERVRQLTVPHETALAYLQQLHDALGTTGQDAELREALHDCLLSATDADRCELPKGSPQT